MSPINRRCTLALVILQILGATSVLAQAPLVIAWQAPPGRDAYGYNSATYTSAGCGSTAVTQFACFTQSVLPNISGAGFVVPWGLIDNCATPTNEAPCASDATCTTNCYNWGWIDKAIGDYVLGIGTSAHFSSGCSGGKACKIVLIVWLTQDSGNLNTFAGTPNTPAYVFSTAYANSLNGGTGCGATCAQDVVVCKGWQGGTGGGWTGGPGITDSAWASGGGAGDYGLWNANASVILAESDHDMTTHSTVTNFSGYPVMYEQPVMTAAEAFISALALHYSSACVFTSCTTSWSNTLGNFSISGATIAPYIAYLRIGPSSGGENYPYCACSSSTGGSQCDQFYWPGPTGYNNNPSQQYSDQGYLTAWPAGVTTWPANDNTGYVAKLYKYLHSLNWAFPVDTPSHTGPASNLNLSYADTEAQLASEYGLGFGMQAASIGDLVTYAIQNSPSSTANWAVHAREFPYVPVHHLQTMNPGNPIQAAQFTICTTATCGGTVGISATGLVSCPSGSNNDCSVFCTSPHWVYISGTSNAALNGIWEVQQPQSSCASNTVQLVDAPSATSSGGVIYSGAHLPLLLPFESQNCQGSFATICSAELWEESLDWAYGTNTVSNTIGNTSSGDSAYQTAISNFLLGLPNATSMHNNMSTNASHY